MMNVQDSYNEWSHTYDGDSNATRDLDQMVTERVLGQFYVENIIEIGCGTGKNTGFLTRLGHRVHAIDFSEGMISKAKEKLTQHSNVTFLIADITQPWPLVDQSTQLVVCNLVLEHIQNLSIVFAEAARVLTTRGHFFVCELHPFKQYAGTVAHYHHEDQITNIPAFVHHISEFVESAQNCGFMLKKLQEWWHQKDDGKPPRLVSFLFEKILTK